MLDKLITIANRDYDGHFTLLKFTTNWRCCFGTVQDVWMDAEKMAVGKTMRDAIQKCLDDNINAYDFGRH